MSVCWLRNLDYWKLTNVWVCLSLWTCTECLKVAFQWQQSGPFSREGEREEDWLLPHVMKTGTKNIGSNLHATPSLFQQQCAVILFILFWSVFQLLLHMDRRLHSRSLSPLTRQNHSPVIIGASLSEPHTNESNNGIFIYYYVSVVRRFVNASWLF